jgi:Acetolactate synthase, small (regulatory) subunit
VNNEAGVLARVVGLFSERSYNIESLAVAEVDPKIKYFTNYNCNNWNTPGY